MEAGLQVIRPGYAVIVACHFGEVWLCESEEVAETERRREKLAIGPGTIKALAEIKSILGGMVESMGYPKPIEIQTKTNQGSTQTTKSIKSTWSNKRKA